MILVNYSRKDGKISSMSAKGHAEYADHGEDLVCSAASIVQIGGINAIAKLGYIGIISYKVDAGDVEVKINNTDVMELQMILETILAQYESIAEEYPQYITVQEV